MKVDKSEHIAIKEAISEYLGFRHSAAQFFEFLDSLSEENVIVDFENVILVSRSFAHEYKKRKNEIDKNVIEINVPENIDKMFSIVQT